MPSVGMRRTTRCFGVVKGADSARVLRSGRRLWPDSGEVKNRRGNEGEEWMKKLEKKNSDATPRGTLKPNKETAIVNGTEDMVKQRARKRPSLSESNKVDRFFGAVYSRKRKRVSAASGVAEDAHDDKRMFRLQFSRRHQRMKNQCQLAVVVKRPSIGESGLFSWLLFLVLSHITRSRLALKELCAFLQSEPICGAYASRGIHFLRDSPTATVGICKFFGIKQFIPLFCVDFSAVPLCFEYLHSAMLLRYMFKSFSLVYNPVCVASDAEEESDFPEFQIELQIPCNSFKREHLETGNVSPDVSEVNGGLSLHASVKGSRLPSRNGHYRTVSSKVIQRRRTSLRKRKARNPSMLGRSNGALVSDSKVGQKRMSAGVASSNKRLRSLPSRCSNVHFTEASSAMVESTKGLDSSQCSANILITESDRCYRVEGAVVSLDMADSREWLLAVKKDGLIKCTFKAEKVMRPCSSNRHTHMIVFSLDNGWKLEFANRRDWIVFKDLYKECSSHNIPAPAAKFIPVPGVREVSGYAESNSIAFNRPDTYISTNGDELSRALTKKTANYDMDSEDEEWLSKFNNECQEHISEDKFELIVDALEKAYYCNPDGCLDENSAANWCQALASKEVVKAVYIYWMTKRKQKRSLLRVFQSHQAKKAPLIPKPLLRKRRSFKRQPSQFGRGKHPSVLQAIAAEQDAVEEKNSMLKVEQAKLSANESKEFAIQKRKRAQSLMENADLAIYKATMLVRIAEAAQAGESVDALAGYFLD